MEWGFGKLKAEGRTVPCAWGCSRLIVVPGASAQQSCALFICILLALCFNMLFFPFLNGHFQAYCWLLSPVQLLQACSLLTRGVCGAKGGCWEGGAAMELWSPQSPVGPPGVIEAAELETKGNTCSVSELLEMNLCSLLEHGRRMWLK